MVTNGRIGGPAGAAARMVSIEQRYWHFPFSHHVKTPLPPASTDTESLNLRDELLRWLFHGEQSLLSEGPAHPILPLLPRGRSQVARARLGSVSIASG
jgi:hypothetical protein